MLVVVLICIGLFVVINTFASVFGSLPLKSAAMGVVSAILGASVVGLLWEVTVRRAFADEMRLQFTELLGNAIGQTVLGSVGESEGVISLTRDFHHGIPWGKYIADSADIDLCWWAGSAWIEQNLVELRIRAEKGLKLRLVVPDVGRTDVINQMAKDSGLSVATLKQATIDAVELLSTLPNNCASVRYSHRVPRYMFIRLGNIVMFATYPLSPGKNSGRPTVLCSISGPMGSGALEEFIELFASSSDNSEIE